MHGEKASHLFLAAVERCMRDEFILDMDWLAIMLRPFAVLGLVW